jgi:Flp pilus assembly protein TadG
MGERLRRQAWSGMRRLRRGLGDEQGNAEAVELAFALPILLMVVFAIVVFCQAMYAYHFVSYAAQEGARYAIVRGNDQTGACATTTSFGCVATSANVQSYVQGLATTGIISSNVTVDTTSTFLWPGTTPCTTGSGRTCPTCTPAANANSPGCYVQVQVQYTFNYFGPISKLAPLTITATSEKVIQ